ncbi:MAG TPA: dihydroorotate dehydrogenase (quinone) [Streptosporangiaceae bacterium]|nr:dihydroorotate dehydrogenase (quinone) [Streptosporangiaceae bacterium]
MYKLLFATVLRRIPAETAHTLGFWLIRSCSAVPLLRVLVRAWLARPDEVLAVRALGLDFASPVGLAAGFDKDARAPDAFGMLGFAFVEVGTVTAEAQPGNPKPRMFRLPADRALVNRMGFNNHGAAAAAARLRARRARRSGAVGPARPVGQSRVVGRPRPASRSGAVGRARPVGQPGAVGRARPVGQPLGRPVVVGVNIGKTKAVPYADVIGDYVASAKAVGREASYLVVNVSSPNTPGLRDLQEPETLRSLLTAVRAALDGVADRRVPLLVKLALDLADEDIEAVARVAVDVGADGIIAGNTAVSRAGLVTPAQQVEAAGPGGLSGAPLRARAVEVLARLHAQVGGKLVLVSTGGIETWEDAWERIQAGATLIQGYTGFVYAGPTWARDINAGLARQVRRTGLDSIQQAVGMAATSS